MGLGKVLCPVSSTSLHPMLKKVPTPEGAVWPQGCPKQSRMADSVSPSNLPGARSSLTRVARPQSSSTSFTQISLGVCRRTMLPPKPESSGPRSASNHHGGHYPAARPHEPSGRKPEPHAHSCGDVCSEPGVPVSPKSP